MATVRCWRCGSVRGDLGRCLGIGRVGQVVAERDLDAGGRRRGADYDQAALGGEAEQVRDDGQEAGRGADLQPRPLWVRVHRWFLP
jgi:hypothetical protein